MHGVAYPWKPLVSLLEMKIIKTLVALTFDLHCGTSLSQTLFDAIDCNADAWISENKLMQAHQVAIFLCLWKYYMISVSKSTYEMHVFVKMVPNRYSRAKRRRSIFNLGVLFISFIQQTTACPRLILRKTWLGMT